MKTYIMLVEYAVVLLYVSYQKVNISLQVYNMLNFKVNDK